MNDQLTAESEKRLALAEKYEKLKDQYRNARECQLLKIKTLTEEIENLKKSWKFNCKFISLNENRNDIELLNRRAANVTLTVRWLYQNSCTFLVDILTIAKFKKSAFKKYFL